MTKVTNLGIWMDHANAHLIEFNAEQEDTQSITSKFTHQEKERSIEHGEKTMHNAEKHEQSDYFKKISAVIAFYKNVVLFGPTSAKTELFNLLRADHHFDNIKIEVHQTDKMTENQQHAYVKDYFLHHGFKSLQP